MLMSFNLDVLCQKVPAELGQLGEYFLIACSSREDFSDVGNLSAKSLKSRGNFGAKVLVQKESQCGC